LFCLWWPYCLQRRRLECSINLTIPQLEPF
jgi:hypothetical protein